MKRFATIAIALSAVLLIAAPAMALDTTFSGEFLVRGFHNDHQGLRNTDGQSNYMDGRFRLKTVFQIADNLKLTARLDALDEKVWGDSDSPDATGLGQDESSNIDFDRAFMSLDVLGGTLDIGRMGGMGPDEFGTSFVDDVDATLDRIRYTLALGDFTFTASVDKVANGDAGDFTQSDGDRTGYNVAGVYSLPKGHFGLLMHYDTDNVRPDLDGDGMPDMLDWNDDGIGDQDADRKSFTVNPYVDLPVTDTINLRGEVKFELGTWEYDVGPDDEIKRLIGNVEMSKALGTSTPAGIVAGWMYMAGDYDSTAADFMVGNFGPGTYADDYEQRWFGGGPGPDWERVWILTNDADLGASMLGGVGNLIHGAGRYGANLLYVGLTLSPLENLDLEMLFASSTAADVPGGWGDEHGLEWDVSLSYKLTENLTYRAVAAYLSVGNFWKLGDDTVELEDTFSIFNQLALTF